LMSSLPLWRPKFASNHATLPSATSWTILSNQTFKIRPTTIPSLFNSIHYSWSPSHSLTFGISTLY
jgi:hypothetical protein